MKNGSFCVGSFRAYKLQHSEVVYAKQSRHGARVRWGHAAFCSGRQVRFHPHQRAQSSWGALGNLGSELR